MLTLWTVRLAAIAYLTAVYALLLLRPTIARPAWTIGLLFYLAHVAAAFHFHHHWSHAHAYAETARQTQALFGIHYGGGLYWNYLFTLVWLADALWWNLAPAAYSARAPILSRAIHTYMAFLFVNAAIVFPTGPIRYLSLAALLPIPYLMWSNRRSR